MSLERHLWNVCTHVHIDHARDTAPLKSYEKHATTANASAAGSSMGYSDSLDDITLGDLDDEDMDAVLVRYGTILFGRKAISVTLSG